MKRGGIKAFIIIVLLYGIGKAKDRVAKNPIILHLQTPQARIIDNINPVKDLLCHT